jgi:hypothetical protein
MSWVCPLRTDRFESDKDYNYYLFGYQPANDYPVEGIMPGVKLETALVSYSFPTEERDVDSIIYGAIKDSASDIISDYGLEPFSMKVQSVSRTFIDKIYALCDYYMEDKTKRFSRHLYDLHMLYPTITVDDSFMGLIQQVREHRSKLPICPSAKEGVDIKSLITEFLDKEFYKSDYDNITRTLISDDVTYEQTSLTLREIAEKLF